MPQSSRDRPSKGVERGSYDSEDTSTTQHPIAQARRRPIQIVTIDWRSEICRVLGLSNESSDEALFEELDAAEKNIKDAKRLKLQLATEIGPPRFQVVYNIQCNQVRSQERNSFYLNVPWVVQSGPTGAHLMGSRHVRNMDLYLERNKEISFLVIREFACCSEKKGPVQWQVSNEGQSSEADLLPFFEKEYLEVVSADTQSALAALSRTALKEIDHPRFLDSKIGAISYPYFWWFHRRGEIEAAKLQADSAIREHINLLEQYMEDRLKHEWDAVDEMTARGRITFDLLEYIFVPDSILISRQTGDEISELHGLATSSWLIMGNPKTDKFIAKIEVTYWTFDGLFHRAAGPVLLTEVPGKSPTEEFDIVNLAVYPARFAQKGILEGLRDRGSMFWKCRHRKYISYLNSPRESMQLAVNARFMVDIETYARMHPPPSKTTDLTPEQRAADRASSLSITMTSDEPPSTDDFLLCLPSTIKGFDMTKKDWSTLKVAFIQDVVWNDQAFEDLVIHPSTKDLVKAVVTNRLRAEKNIDLIQGKGNGLFILLHGGPGTGKTLTAESVAEIARKPLYRVTCGDIGTKADEVEKYLEVVALLGKKWDCVVLLDEADVFLEQRSLANLERNALVSVFLRVLEYYDGILILTTNRVGTFDEAFKSRIQLTLRYNNLDEKQRFQIWRNFIRRLQPVESSVNATMSTPNDYGINVEQIQDHLPILAKENLNGREIRNAISTARQLASYQECPLEYSHLRTVMDEGKKFEEYLKVLHRGISVDDIQFDQGAR